MAYLGPSSAPSRGALLRRHRLPRYRRRLSRAMGKRPSPSGLGRFPGFPARAFARVESRAARLTVPPVYGPIRYRTPPALCPEDLSIWRNGSSVLASPAWLPHGCLAPILRPLGCAGRLDADVQTVPSMALGLDFARVRLVLFSCCSGMSSRNVSVLDVLGVVGDWHAGRVVE